MDEKRRLISNSVLAMHLSGSGLIQGAALFKAGVAEVIVQVEANASASSCLPNQHVPTLRLVTSRMTRLGPFQTLVMAVDLMQGSCQPPVHNESESCLEHSSRQHGYRDQTNLTESELITPFFLQISGIEVCGNVAVVCTQDHFVGYFTSKRLSIYLAIAILLEGPDFRQLPSLRLHFRELGLLDKSAD